MEIYFSKLVEMGLNVAETENELVHFKNIHWLVVLFLCLTMTYVWWYAFSQLGNMVSHAENPMGHT